MRLEDKVAIVTGAGGGIGLAYAERFLREGAKVVIAEVGEEQGRDAEARLSSLGDARFIRTDISDEKSVSACLAGAEKAYGTVDILLNNAAIYGDYEPLNNDLDYLKRVFDVNVHGQWLMARAVAPGMVARRTGRIVNIASIAAYLHQIGAMTSDADNFQLSSYAYQQSKWGVVGLTRHMAGQLGQFNVTVNCIAPGLTMTPATEKQVPGEIQPMFATMSAMQRNAEPDHMTGVAVFFASDDAAMVNGQILCVDGGNVMPV